jgi:hypothetical protein
MIPAQMRIAVFFMTDLAACALNEATLRASFCIGSEDS